MDNNSGYSLSDIAALMGNKGFGNGDGLGWLILICLFLMPAFMGRGFGGNGSPAPAPVVPPNVATMNDVQTAINNQSINSGIQQILLSSANNNYETAQLLTSQNNANQVNMIQGFNAVTGQVNQQTATISSELQSIKHQVSDCCCEVKTMLLQQQLDEANRKLADAQNKNNIAEQTQVILRSLGRFVAYEGTGTAAATSIAS